MLSICCNSRVKSQKKQKKTQKVTKIKLFIYEYNWEGINVEKDDWKKFEKNNLTIALNVLYAKKEKIYPAYVSNITQTVKSKLFF